MRNFKRLAQGLPVGPLLERLARYPELWESGRARSEYPGSPHADAQAIMLRGPAEQNALAMFRDLDQVDYPAAYVLMPQLGILTNNVFDRVGLAMRTGRSMITRLPPGARIQPHVDEGLYADYYDRFHVCLDAEGSLFRCGAEEVLMQPGEAWWFNHKLEHEIWNGGTRDRLHLILDLAAPAYKRLRGLTLQAEQLSDLWPEVRALLAAHWREVAHYQDIELDPDEEVYAHLEQTGQLRVYTARMGSILVGYVAFFVRPNHHYAGSLQAWQDVLYLAPEHRRGLAGVRLIRFAEQRLAAEGVQVVYHHAKRTNRVGELLGRLGYDLVDEIYAKRLDKKGV